MVGDVLPVGGARTDVLAGGGDGAFADGLAGVGEGDRAGGLAGGDCAGGDDGEEHLDDVGIDVLEESEGLSNLEESFTPATHSQSIVLFKSRTTFALMGNDPEANPS